MQVRQITHGVSFEDRVAHEAERARAQARTMPPGKGRDALTERARQAETVAQISEIAATHHLQSEGDDNRDDSPSRRQTCAILLSASGR